MAASVLGEGISPKQHQGDVAARLLVWALYLPPLLVLLLYFWGYLDHAWGVVTFPYQIDYGEATELSRAWLLSQGRPIYVDWSTPPYQMMNYTPLYELVLAILVRLQGLQFFSGRLISLVSTLMGGLLIASTALALGAGVRGALVGGLLWFVGHPVWNWGALQRVDALAIALELAGIAVFSDGWVRRRHHWGVWASVPLFLAAVYTRQTMVAGAFACYSYLLFRQPRLALGTIGAYVAGGLSLFALLWVMTDGLVWRNMVEGNLNRWSWAIVQYYGQPLWRLQYWAFGLALGAVLFALVKRRAQVPALYLVASAASALTIGKIGSNVNYLLPLWAAVCLLVGLAAGEVTWLASRMAGRCQPHRMLAIAGRLAVHGAFSLVLLVGLQRSYHVPYVVEGDTVLTSGPAAVLERLQFARWPLWRLSPQRVRPGELTDGYRDVYLAKPAQWEWESARQAHAFVAALPGDVLSEDMAFTISTGKRIYLQPFEFTQMAEQGDWDQRPLLDDIRRQHFSAVVLRFALSDDPTWHRDRINQPMIEAIADAYELAAEFGTYYLYRPRSR
ncbi:MAG TPA: hypothetical protein VGW38_09355 [Chloroflexota bacterium]|nr:hypothetical protein [Chloroflexota bacterium]